MKVRIMQIVSTKDVFATLAKHDLDTHDPCDDFHSTQLCKRIAHKYLDTRLFRYQQVFTDEVIHKGKLGKRQQLTKSIMFSGL